METTILTLSDDWRIMDPMVDPLSPLLLTEVQAAQMLGVSVGFLRDQRLRRTGPRYCKIGRRSNHSTKDMRLVRYSVADLKAYVGAQDYMPSHEPATGTQSA